MAGQEESMVTRSLNLINFVISHPLNSGNKLKALLHLAKWQITSRLNSYPVIYPFTEHSKFIIRKGMTGATQNVYCGLQDYEDMGFLLHLLRPDDLFVDIGANVGSYTILASAEIGANSISVEPVPTTFHHLRDNISINDIQQKVELINIGLGNSTGTITFTKSHDTMNHVATNKDTDTINVPIDTVDNILKDKHPILLKIDVEGYEIEVLKGAENILAQKELKAIIIELNGSGDRYGYDEHEIHNKLSNLGFSPFLYNPPGRKLVKRPTSGSPYNFIYVRDLDFVNDRLSKARGIIVRGREI